MTAIVTNMPAGFAGEATRSDGAVVVSLQLAADLAHGSPVKITSGKAAAIESGDTADVFYGVLTRSAPSVSDSSTGNADTDYVQSILRKGFVNVACKQGTPAIGGAVYVRVTADTGKLVGDFETAADSGKCVAITGATWATAGKDSNNIAEAFFG